MPQTDRRSGSNEPYTAQRRMRWIMLALLNLAIAMSGAVVARADSPPPAQLVKDIKPTFEPGGSAQPGIGDGGFAGDGSTIYFTARDAELWKSDGTPAGTALVKDINPGRAGSEPSFLTILSGTLFFRADDGSTGPELWKSDGTPQGTVLVKDIFPSYYGSGLQQLTNVNGTLFFIAQRQVNYPVLWKSDGTPDGTAIVKETAADWLTSVDGTLFFTARDSPTGRSCGNRTARLTAPS